MKVHHMFVMVCVGYQIRKQYHGNACAALHSFCLSACFCFHTGARRHESGARWTLIGEIQVSKQTEANLSLPVA
jgi:hypothetical protein